MTLTGTTRCLGPQARAFLHAEMERIVRGITQAAGAGCKFSWQDGYPSVMNDEGLTKLAEQLIESRFGAERVLHISPLMPGEDYPYFLENGKRPGFFVELGTRNAACGSDQPHHNPHFKIDEDCLKYGVQFLPEDFRPYFREGQERARALDIYMQKYCGCIFSEEDRYKKKKKKKPAEENGK